MGHRQAIAVLGLLIPWIAAAQGDDNSYVCTYGDLQRRVEIFYEPGRAVPCEVHYYKDTEAPGERQILWRAQNESGYCESRTREFVAQLQSQGWSCSAGMVEPAAPAGAGEGEPAAPPADPTIDDTDALVPAEEPEPADQKP